jgi:cell division protein FtsB
MKGLIPIAFLISLLVIVAISILGKGGYPHLQSLRHSLDRQNSRNDDRQLHIKDLKAEVYSLERDDRALEKAARENLGMARPNEEVYFFEDSEEAGAK